MVSAEKHFVICKRSAEGFYMRFAYEHLLIVTEDDVAANLQGLIHEHVLSTKRHAGKPHQSASNNYETSNLHHMKSNRSCDNIQSYELGDLLDINNYIKIENDLPPLHTSLVSSNATQDINGSIGKFHSGHTEMFPRSKQQTLYELGKRIGKGTVSRTHLKSAPPWLVQRAVNNKIFDA